MVELKRNLEFAIESAKLAGNFLSENYSKELDVVMDEGRDIKLKVDQEAEKIITTSTAEAAKLAQNDKNIYCIANLYAADLFGLVNHTSDIQDTKNNRTRFLVISKSLEKKGQSNKTSVMINLKDQPGSLMKILKPFSDLKINKDGNVGIGTNSPDEKLEVAKLYNMLEGDAGVTSMGRTAVDNETVRTVYIIRPDKRIGLFLTYPMTTGRNFAEILRAIDSMQRTAKHKIATPADWKPGEDVIIVPKVTNEEAKKIYPDGWETIKPYLRKVPDPQK